MNELRCDVAIVGAGVAGLTTALQLAPSLRVVLLCKTELGNGAATAWAQGGIAAALSADDAPALHAADTLRAAAGIADEHAVATLVGDAPERIDALLRLGVAFDGGESRGLALGLEAGHSRRRIVRAGGDSTGREVLRALVAAVRERPNVRVVECAQADDVLRDGDRVVGAIAHDVRTGDALAVRARAIVLATGGSGRLYRYTTNPAEATGDGIAIAARAGALLADMEFVQFHPTALAVDRDPLPLVTEAIRGEGAVLLDDRGERFMLGIHPDAELAPRDVVARAIFERRCGARTVVLDARTAVGDAFPERFPTVFASCVQAGIDPRVEPIPVTPAAHYTIGGVAVDERGRSSLPGLWACGETAATGVHGANRLASNSLLEALVFATHVARDVEASLSDDSAANGFEAPVTTLSGARSADTSLADASVTGRSAGSPSRSATSLHRATNDGVNDGVMEAASGEAAAIARLRAVMYADVGVERDAEGLRRALDAIGELDETAPRAPGLRNLLTVGRLIARAALDREESRGTHFRRDFPAANPALAHRSFTRLEPVA